MFDDLEIKKGEEEKIKDSIPEKVDGVSVSDSPLDIFSEVEPTVNNDLGHLQEQQESLAVNEGKERPEVFKRKVEKSLDGHKKNSNKIIIILVLTFFIVIIVLGGYLFFNSKTSIDTTFKIEEKSDLSESSKQALDEEKEDSSPVEAGVEDSDKSVEQDMTDTDQDGLTDAEERELGTNINSIDSDFDGLFDREEVRVYKTDPLNKDTDGDSFLDGDEVRAGYNPNGEGKLYDIK